MPRRSVHPLRKRCLDLAGDESLMFADGYDDAILGIGWRDGVAIVAYDTRRVINILHRRDGMTSDEAEEFFLFNVAGTWLGEQTPIFIEAIRR